VSKPLTLGAIPTSPGTARAAARYLLAEWGLSHLADTVELIVSELVTNAVQVSVCHQIPPPVQFGMSSAHGSVLIEVWDCDPSQPVMRQPMDIDESGRGLMLVATLSRQWGWAEFGQGKIVWAEVG
jgi:anti-sigma regulatory factor (Ser/Thr protein kinase)